MQYIVAVDSGGTFADCVVLDEKGRVTRAKAPSTPHDYSIGILQSVANAAGLLGLSARELLERAVLFCHGTTVATNTVLTRGGCKAGLITTKGHEDALLIGRVIQKIAGLTEAEIIRVAHLDKPSPLIPRQLIKGISERVDWKGAVVAPLNMRDVEQAVAELVNQGVEAIAVSLLWSFRNPSHEQAIKEYIQSRHPDLPVTTSSELCPVMKEYERTATAAINTYLSKATSRYLHGLATRLAESGHARPPLVMQSSGGVVSIAMAAERPVALLSSGPAGGVIAARTVGDLLGWQNVITTDVGGTSFDVGLIVDGEVQYADQPVISQYSISFPMIDVVSIGAGGGSIAWIESGSGLLRVGPKSAGAVPGPVCYDQGGVEPTVTDANLVLGRINPDYFLGGAQKLDREKAWQAIDERVAGPLKMSVHEAALGIVEIADAHMADLVRKVTIERGHDPRRFVLFAFGGAGPLHVGRYARDVGVRTAVIPAFASEFSAFGIAASDITVVEEVSELMLAPLDLARLEAIFQRLEAQVARRLAENGVEPNDQRLQRGVKMRYGGQVHEIAVPVPSQPLDAAGHERLLDAFERRYEEKYGKGAGYKKAGIQAITYEVRGFGTLYTPSLERLPEAGEDPAPAFKGKRDAYFREYGEPRPTAIFDYARLRPGNRLEGPAIVEAVDTTLVIHPGQTAQVDAYQNLLLFLEGKAAIG